MIGLPESVKHMELDILVLRLALVILRYACDSLDL